MKNKPTKKDIQQAEIIDLRKVDPLGHLPDWTKHPKNYKLIQKALLETTSCKKSHSDPMEMSNCITCTQNMVERRRLMQKFGFKGPEDYMQWKKVHEEIKKYVSKEDYERILNS